MWCVVLARPRSNENTISLPDRVAGIGRFNRSASSSSSGSGLHPLSVRRSQRPVNSRSVETNRSDLASLIAWTSFIAQPSRDSMARSSAPGRIPSRIAWSPASARSSASFNSPSSTRMAARRMSQNGSSSLTVQPFRIVRTAI